MIDVVYIAASARDARYTRICIASVRRFYPDLPVKLLVGGPLEEGLAEEVERYWNVGLADFPRKDYGWGFVKLEPLFRSPGERFLMIDSDTAMTGPVLDLLVGHDEDLVVDDEDQTEKRGNEIYFDRPAAAASGMTIERPDFLFNSGQWFGKSGALARDDFNDLITWNTEPPRLALPAIFKNGDQGVMNFVANKKVRTGELTVGRVPLMCWPGMGMGSLSARTIQDGSAEPRVIHWAGIKKASYSTVTGGDILIFFEKEYYSRLPNGQALRRKRAFRHAVSHHWRNSRVVRRLARLMK